MFNFAFLGYIFFLLLLMASIAVATRRSFQSTNANSKLCGESKACIAAPKRHRRRRRTPKDQIPGTHTLLEAHNTPAAVLVSEIVQKADRSSETEKSLNVSKEHLDKIMTLEAQKRALVGKAKKKARQRIEKKILALKGVRKVQLTQKAVKEGCWRQINRRNYEKKFHTLNFRPGASVKRTDGKRVHRVQKYFKHIEFGINSVDGLELHSGIISPEHEQRLIDWVEQTMRKGRAGALHHRATYLAPPKTMRGKGRRVLQFGVFYDYIGHKINIQKQVDSMPTELLDVVDLLMRLRVLPPTARPDSCIINAYAAGDCIPPHIDHVSYPRPFCTVSLQSVAPIQFGQRLRVEGPGAFGGGWALPLPRGSVAVLQGNAADIAKHCIPSVPEPRISLTFRIIPSYIRAELKRLGMMK